MGFHSGQPAQKGISESGKKQEEVSRVKMYCVSTKKLAPKTAVCLGQEDEGTSKNQDGVHWQQAAALHHLLKEENWHYEKGKFANSLDVIRMKVERTQDPQGS